MRHLVIITYALHYHICQVAIKLAIQRFNPDKVTILVDNPAGTMYGWDNLGSELTYDLKINVGLTNPRIHAISFTALPDIQTEPWGWIRQQYIKLNLHKILPGDEWLVIDGDTLINEDINPYDFVYVNSNDYILTPQNAFFVRYALDLGNKELLFNNKLIELNGPIKVLNRKTLEGLENYIYELHGTDVKGIRDSFTLKQNRRFYVELSEYDLIAYYQAFISKDLKPLKHVGFYYHSSGDFVSNWDLLKDKIAILDGKDDIPSEWYAQFGVKINQELWEKLGYTKK